MNDTYEMIEARRLLAEGQYGAAKEELAQTPEVERSAEWYYLLSQIEDKMELHYNALLNLKQAVQMDPQNKTYKAALKAKQKALRREAKGEKKRTGRGGCHLPGCCSSENCWDCCGDICGEVACECCCDCD